MVWHHLNHIFFKSLRSESIKSTTISSTIYCSAPFRRTAFGQSAIFVKATTQWDTLQDNIKNCNSIGSFKNLLKDPQFCNH